MKVILFGGLISSLIIAAVQGQSIDPAKKTRYAVELNQFITESGFATGTELYVTIIPDNKKNLSFGTYFCSEQKKISGLTVHHEMMLVHKSTPQTATLYAFYNMIYRFTRTGKINSEQKGEISYGLYKCLEHHLGLGLDVAILKGFHIKGAIGYGVYFGSIKKPSGTDLFTKEATGSNGFGRIAKIGMSYIL